MESDADGGGRGSSSGSSNDERAASQQGGDVLCSATIPGGGSELDGGLSAALLAAAAAMARAGLGRHFLRFNGGRKRLSTATRPDGCYAAQVICDGEAGDDTHKAHTFGVRVVATATASSGAVAVC